MLPHTSGLSELKGYEIRAEETIQKSDIDPAVLKSLSVPEVKSLPGDPNCIAVFSQEGMLSVHIRGSGSSYPAYLVRLVKEKHEWQVVAGWPIINPRSFRKVDAFSEGDVHIRKDMSKENVLSELRKKVLPTLGEQFQFRLPDGNMYPTDTWTLRYGGGSGTAPGAFELRLSFVNKKVTTIEHRDLCLK